MKRAVIIAGCVVALLLAGGFIIQVATLDGLDGFILSMLFEDSTQYAPGYTATAFRQIETGMREEQVYTLLGKPLDTHSRDNTFYLWYSKPKKSHFRNRMVILRHGLVVDKNAEFYVD